MNIYFHPVFLKQYAFDSTAEPERLEPTIKVIEKNIPLLNPGQLPGRR